MPNLNKVQLMGNLTRDPEIKYTPKGMAVAELGLAVNRSWKDDKGTKHEETTFVDIELWGRTAELAGEYLKKGRPVYIEGRLKLETWDDKQTGQKRSKMKVVCENMQFLHQREGGEKAEQAPARREAPQTMRAPKPADPDLDAAEDDGEIPF